MLIRILLLYAFRSVTAASSITRPIKDRYEACTDIEKANRNSGVEVDPSRSRVVQVTLHEPAYLHCRVMDHPDHVVAWTRLDDNTLLTVGDQSFTSDARFQMSMRKANGADWVLIIRRTEKSDSGCYVCEVNTEPNSELYATFLNVIEYDAQLDVSKQGTTISLDCIVTLNAAGSAAASEQQRSDNDNDDATELVVWTRNGSLLNTDDSHKYASSKTKRSDDNRNTMIVHTLLIREANERDDGVYACKADNAPITEKLVLVNSTTNIIGASTISRLLMLLLGVLLLLSDKFVHL